MVKEYYAIDCETDALVNPTVVHCVVLRNSVGFQLFDKNNPDYSTLRNIMENEIIVGHNVIDFDFPVLSDLLGCPLPERFYDTLVLSRMFNQPLVKAEGHSLEVWGNRLGIPKVGVDIDNFSEYTENIRNRCIRDTKINRALFDLFVERMNIEL